MNYYYLHTNGDLIYKVNYNPCDLRESDFVRAFWLVDPMDRENAWSILVEALSFGANKERVFELAKKWKCDNDDAVIYADYVGAILVLDEGAWRATRKDFINLQESPVGYGESGLEALSSLAKELGLKPGKMWRTTFRDLLCRGLE